MNQYPPGNYIGGAMKTLPPADPGLPPQVVVVDADPMWGRYRVTFQAKCDPNPRMGNTWVWTIKSGERIDLSK